MIKAGQRALGIAESYRSDDETSVLAGAVIRKDRVLDGATFGQCTVGGIDSTSCIIELYRSLDREDLQYVFLSGIALAWYNIVDLKTVHHATDQPVIAVSYESSSGLESPISEAFSGEQRDQRLRLYRQLPERTPITVNDNDLYFRVVGLEEEKAREIITAYTPEGGRPEPLRVARLLARAKRSTETEP